MSNPCSLMKPYDLGMRASLNPFLVVFLLLREKLRYGYYVVVPTFRLRWDPHVYSCQGGGGRGGDGGLDRNGLLSRLLSLTNSIRHLTDPLKFLQDIGSTLEVAYPVPVVEQVSPFWLNVQIFCRHRFHLQYCNGVMGI